MNFIVFKMTGTPLWSSRETAIVAAEKEADAHACMTAGSDSLWSEVTSCVNIGRMESGAMDLAALYSAAGAYILE